MKRLVALGFLLGVGLLGLSACDRSFSSLCAVQVPPPAGCDKACNPQPAAANECDPGYHCSADGKCDLQCTQIGNECGDDYLCSSEGYCDPVGQSPTDPDDNPNCPKVHVGGTKVTPTVQLILDKSGSMVENEYPANSGVTRWSAMVTSLVGANGIVRRLADKVVFGATTYESPNSGTCPVLAQRPRALNNFAAIQSLLSTAPTNGNTPTGAAIDAVRMDFAANPPAMGSPPIIVLATDGLPDTCTDRNPEGDDRINAANEATVAAAQAAYRAGIRLFFLFVGDTSQTRGHPQRMANAGAGVDLATGGAMFYQAANPNELANAFEQIIGNVVSCEIRLDKRVDGDPSAGIVTINNGQPLTYGTDWTLDADGMTIRLLGAACNSLQSATSPVVDASFPCGTIIF